MKPDLSPEALAEFWRWFEDNDEELFHLDQNSIDLIGRLSEALRRVDQHLTFEMSHVFDDGSREFIISANGIKSSFRSVDALYAASSCSSLRRWKVIRFRQRHQPVNDMKCVFGGLSVDASQVYYALFREKKPGKLGVMLFLRGYSVKDRETWDQIGFIILHAVLGEYDVETHLGEIMILSYESEYFRKARPLAELPSHFDNMLGRP